MTVYYNEIDPYAAQWLRNLMAAGHIAEGEVDERSITEVQHEDLSGFDQCHFFAGIGVWSHALRRAGWPDDRPVWTGSCPCQPFSAAGKQQRFDDDRHLWPVWFNLIRECRPPVVVGEQVASALDWLDLVSADMEAAGYAIGAADLCAAGFGGAHIRQRLYFVGLDHTTSARHGGPVKGAEEEARDEARLRLLGEGCGIGGLADAGCSLGQRRPDTGRPSETNTGQRQQGAGDDQSRGSASGLADANDAGRQLFSGGEPAGVFDEKASPKERQFKFGRHSTGADQPHAPLLGRDAADWLFCRDGKWRPVEPGTFPLVDAAFARVGRLRAYGNGLDAETATQFIAAVMDCAP